MRSKNAYPHPIFIDPAYPPKKQTGIYRTIGQLTLAIILLLGASLALQHKAMASEEPIQSGEFLFSSTDGKTFYAPHITTHINATINGLLAEVIYTQEFNNPTDQWFEGHYHFPLPDNASVNQMTMHIGERQIEGKIHEKKIAKEMYRQAMKAGKSAALTQQQRPNIFSQHVANIAPHETIRITLRYLQPIHYQQGAFEWRLPTTLTPRYKPSNTPPSEIKPSLAALNHLISPSGWSQTSAQGGNSFSLSVTLNSGLPLSQIDAPYHDIKIKKENQKNIITLRNKHAAMDRDFVLQWEPSHSNAPKAALFKEVINGQHYAMLMLVPPTELTQENRLARDIVFIIDTSGSMGGSSIKQAKSSLILAIDQLTPDDRFNIIEFNSTSQSLYDDYTAVNSETLHYAKHWIKNLNASGGTEMLPALQEAFNHSDSIERLQQIIFITDGAVSNESSLFHSINTQINSARLFTVGIGSAPNSFFMRKAAQLGRGSYTHIGDIDEVEMKMVALFQKLNNTTHKDINIDWGTKAEQYPEKVTELYAGEALMLSAKLTDDSTIITINGESATGPWQKIITPSSDMPLEQHSGIASLWARKKIEQIEDKGITGQLDPKNLRAQILETALEHQLLSRFTSFIAIEKEIARPATETKKSVRIKNTQPRGQKLQQVPYPKTGTWSNLWWWLGIFCFMGYLLMHAIRNEP